MVRRKLLTSPRLRKKKQKALFEKAAVLLSLCVALFFAVLYFFNADYISIKSIEVLSADSNIDSVKSIVEEELKRQKFGMFPQNNFIFLSGDNLTAAVQKVFPEVLQIDAKFNGINDLIVEVKHKSTFAIWCDEDEKLCFDIDETGIAFKDFEGNGSSTPLVLVSNDKPVLSQKITSDQRFLKIGMFITAFQKGGIDLVKLEDGGSNLYAELKDGTEIRMNFSDDPDDVISRLSVILANERKMEVKTPLKYIDLRFGNKVYLKRE